MKKKSMLRLKNVNKTVLLVVILFVAGMIAAALLWNYRIAEVREIPMSFYVEPVAGFNADTDEIYFGSAPRGNSGSRKIHIEADEELFVTAISLGNISSVVSISDNNFVVGPGNKKTLELVATAPSDDPYITAYTGTLRLVFRRF